MSLNRRVAVPADHFTIISNDWARDAGLSWKARGILVYLMSHRIGWSVSVESLTAAGTDGKDAVRTGVRELIDAGYLTVSRQRNEDGTLGGSDYDLVDPQSRRSDPKSDYPILADPTQVHPTLEDPTPKKTILQEDQLKKTKFLAPQAASPTRGTRLPDDFKATPEMIAWARTEAPHAGSRDHDRFMDHWPAQPGQKGVKLDWVRTWRNWMRKASDDNAPRGSRPGAQGSTTDRRVAEAQTLKDKYLAEEATQTLLEIEP